MTALVAGAGVLAVVLLIVTINLVWARQHSDAMKNAQALDSAGKHADEMQLLEHYLDTKPPKQYQSDVLKKLGGVAYVTGDYHAAYQWYLNADANSSKPDPEVKLGVAQSAEQVKDNATAISYYKQTVALYPNPKGADLVKVQQYGDHIMFLGQGQ